MPSMDFNPRMSIARGAPPPGSHQKQKRQQPDEDAFMTLPDSEIAGCISDIGIPFSVEDLRKPSVTKIQQVFEWFLELLTNTTREVVSPAMRAAAEDMCGPGDADRIFTADTRELMGFFITMRRLLVECGIKDFTFADVYRPTHPRLVKIFSYIINFIRFRESQTTVIDEHYNSSERVKNMMEQLYHSNQEKDDQLREMEQNRKNVEMAIKDKEKRELELKTRLLELSKSQKRVMDKLTEVQDESNRLKGLLEEKTATVLNVRQEANKLRPYTEQSPAALEQALRALSTNLSSDRIEIERLEKRSRALQTSSDSFTLLQTDISSLTRLLLDLKAELAKEDEEARSATQNRDALSTQSNSVREVEREEKRLSKQLDRWLSNTENVRRDADTRAANAKQKMERLRAVHRELTAERRDRGEEVERRRVRIEQTEKKMTDLKDTIEQEVQSAREEYMRMESHIRLYITEMEQSI